MSKSTDFEVSALSITGYCRYFRVCLDEIEFRYSQVHWGIREPGNMSTTGASTSNALNGRAEE